MNNMKNKEKVIKKEPIKKVVKKEKPIKVVPTAICIHCNTEYPYKGNKLFTFCSTCAVLNLLMGKTTAKKEYILNDKDLENLRSLTRKNTYGTECHYYYIGDLKKKADEKHGDKFEELKLKKKERSDRTKALIKEKEVAKNKIRCKNKQFLINKLKTAGLQFREDSALCEEYIEHGEEGQYSSDTIVKILEEMEFLFKNTNYKNLMKKNRHQRYKVNCEEEYRNAMKAIAIKKYMEIHGDRLVPLGLLELARSYDDKIVMNTNSDSESESGYDSSDNSELSLSDDDSE